MEELVDVIVRVDEDLYAKAEGLFREFGLSFEEAVLLFVREVARLGRLPFDLTDEDWDIVRKLEEAEVEAGCTDVRYSSEDVLNAMKTEIEKSMDVEGRFGDTPGVRGKN